MAPSTARVHTLEEREESRNSNEWDESGWESGWAADRDNSNREREIQEENERRERNARNAEAAWKWHNDMKSKKGGETKKGGKRRKCGKTRKGGKMKKRRTRK